MTEKRFVIPDGGLDTDVTLIDTLTGKEYEDKFNDIVDLMNDLHEKKEILEVQLKSAENEIGKLESEINMLTDTCHDCCKEIRKENNELKQLIKKVMAERVVDYPLLCKIKEMVKE